MGSRLCGADPYGMTKSQLARLADALELVRTGVAHGRVLVSAHAND